MSGTSLPLNMPEWKEYFKYLESSIETAMDESSYGINKFLVIREEMEKCYKGMIAKSKNLLTITEVPFLLEFVKTGSAFLALILKYQNPNWIKHILFKPLSTQYTELAQIYTSFSTSAAFLENTSFIDIDKLQHAHNLDLIMLEQSITSYLSKQPKQSKITDELNFVVNKIHQILRPPAESKTSESQGIINHSEFTKQEQIGAGAYAKVFKAIFNATNETIAIKELTRIDMPPRKLFTLKREINCLMNLNHPNCIKFYGVTVIPPFSIITKFIPHGSLYDLLVNNPDDLTPLRRMKIAIGITRGLEYLDLVHVLHRDIKPQNILIDENDHAVLCDFGLSRSFGPKMTAELGTIAYMAPELMGNSFTSYDSSCDTYSFGILLYDLLMGPAKYMQMFPVQIAMRVLKEKYRPELPNDNHSFCELITQCWSQNPRKRPKMSVIRKKLEDGSAILEGTDYEQLKQWISETMPQHQAALNHAMEVIEARDKSLIDKIHTMNPIDPTAPIVLQKLFQSEIPISLQLLDDIFNLINQTKSEEVSSIAGDILKVLLTKDDIEKYVTWDQIFDRCLEVSKNSPDLSLECVRSFAERFEDPMPQLAKIANLPSSHFSIDVIEIILNSDEEKLNPISVMDLFAQKDVNFLTSLFRAVLNVFGPLDNLMPYATNLPPLLAIYLASLAKRARTDWQGVSKLLNTSLITSDDKDSDEMSNSMSTQITSFYEGEESQLCTSLEEIFNALQSIRLEQVSEYSADLIILCLIGKCTDFVKIHLYSICAVSGYYKDHDVSDEVWRTVLFGLDYPETTASSISVIMNVQADSDSEIVNNVWQKLIDVFKQTKDSIYEDPIIRMCQQSNEFEVNELTTALLTDFQKNVQQNVRIASSYSGKQVYTLGRDELWLSLMKVIPKCEFQIAKIIGDFLVSVYEQADIGVNADFIATALNFVYKEDVPFETAKPFLDVICKLCNQRNVLVFCAKRHLGEYIKQLPWKYPDVPGVPVIINKFLSVIA
ncbi:TKL family protein kinase [Trichomonas vaginalis G3]|uniref:TKL family protein kinase n=1 Tax=Trichomonas vaginalis (strain ATCC PRA-98 / G3) TaxID=412133 RepID=A2FN42_TRIV3|nr:protein kinase protein [Trichomonas vaginalis G3]EAX93684.1 TKL family protein kinase [Trichomonas vaginalis G3]KAI5540895.1 protein kinase protein [Trichomonas vaginalis G3]|eukprot:XP_001306614.1 TKL family protein kinase [Trichomonas vaginalis G3]